MRRSVHAAAGYAIAHASTPSGVRPVSGAATAFVEHARTHGDFATAGAAVVLGPGGDGAAIAILGVAGKPTRVRAAEDALRGGAGFREAAELVAGSAGDEYRRALVAELVVRALTAAAGA